jgi:tetratricopeptide (TPR) repeat protein
LVEALGSLYTRQQRFEKARQAFVQASAIFNVAKDTVPLDLIDFLNLRANLHVNLREWPEADSDLTRALRLARDQPSLDPLILELLFRNYAIVLRNTHRKREAHEFEARAAALHTHSGAVVDVSELLAGH